MTMINEISATFLTLMRQLSTKDGRSFLRQASIQPDGLRRTTHSPVLRTQAASASRNSAALNFRAVRMVRVVEAGQSRSNAGRMVISGRMADVCAELDRMVARESATCSAHALPC